MCIQLPEVTAEMKQFFLKYFDAYTFFLFVTLFGIQSDSIQSFNKYVLTTRHYVSHWGYSSE